MAQTLKFGNGNFATKAGSTLCYDDQNGNFKPIPMDFTRASTATRVNKEGLIEVVKSNVPRIDYTDTTNGVLLLEKAATNLVTYSEDFNNSSWTKDNTTITSNQVISPDGTLNADLLTANDGSHINAYTGISTSNNNYSYSVFLKKGNTNIIQPYIYEVGIGFKTISTINFDNETATITVGDISLEKYSNDWFKVSMTLDLTSAVGFTFGIYTESTLGIKTVYAWGAQLEIGNASSYIPTQGSASTRVAETASDSGNSEVFNDSEGVLFVDTATLQEGVTEKIISLSDGTTSNNIYFSFSGAANTIFGLVVSGGSTQASLSTTVSQIQPNKLLIKYKSNDISFWLNGFKVGFDTSANTPSGLKNLSFSYPTNAINFYGKTKEIGYYDTILTDLELETLTSYKSWTSMVNELNLNIIYNG